MNTIKKRIYEEPAGFAGAIQTFIGMLALFGVPLTQEQIGGMMVFMAALLGWWVRRNVTPVDTANRQIELAFSASPVSPLADLEDLKLRKE